MRLPVSNAIVVRSAELVIRGVFGKEFWILSLKQRADLNPELSLASTDETGVSSVPQQEAIVEAMRWEHQTKLDKREGVA